MGIFLIFMLREESLHSQRDFANATIMSMRDIPGMLINEFNNNLVIILIVY